MTHFPGRRPIAGDAAHIWIDDATLTATGTITCQGIVEHGQGYAELCLPDADPEQRRALERCSRYGFDLYRDGTLHLLLAGAGPAFGQQGQGRLAGGARSPWRRSGAP
ncbi:hypothetical protein [Streptomyces sp. NPDC018711]|uniref:hypothetical protein n=1 Tax=Streptomyces sp. NPDC018711 TaxID=3365052 RepID=UPI00378ACED7